MFPNMYFVSAMWPRETRNRGHRRSLSAKSSLCDLGIGKGRQGQGDPMSHCNASQRSSESDITVTVSLKRPKQVKNHEVNGAPVRGMQVNQFSGREKLWFVVFSISWVEILPKTNFKLLSA